MTTVLDEVDVSTPEIRVRQFNSFDPWAGVVLSPALRRALESVEEAVSDTAIVLDEQVPGWHNRVTREIDMGSLYDCVLGQVFGGQPVEPPSRRFFGLLPPSRREMHAARYEAVRCGYGRGLDFFAERGIEERPFVFSSSDLGPLWAAEVAKRKTGGNA